MRVTRAARSWSQLVLQVVLLLTGLGLLQMAAERANRRFDLTPSQQLSLSDVSKKILRQVKEPLQVTVFHRRGERQQYADLLRRFTQESPQIHFELLDLDRYPDRARSFGVTAYGRAALEYAGRRIVTLALPEEQLAGGILHVVRGRSRRIVFTTGHGERTPGGTKESYGRLSAALAAENYTPETVTLLDESVPDGADMVLVAGPSRDFAPVEVDRLAEYLKSGGGVLMLLDPEPLPNLALLLASMGVRLGDDFVVDRERRVLGTDGLAAVVEQWKRGNPISDPDNNPIESGVVLPSARTVDVFAEAPGVQAESIARTSSTSWTMADPDRARRGEEPSQAYHDVPGEASVVVRAELGGGDAPEHGNDDGDGVRRRGRVAVVGDADFASDAYLDVLGNRDLALNAIAWVAGEELVKGARAKRVPEILRPLSPLVLTEPQARTIFLVAAVVEPGLVLVAGLVVVGLRRRRG
jgi:ABC-type uncharacterized transport system involved in gliding motility auxiliary subunit